MADEVVIRSGYSLPVGSDRWEIRDAGKPVEFVDLINEARHSNGVVYLSFASGIIDADNKPVAQVSSRVRMNLGVAQFLHKLLGDMIADALTPSDKSKAN